MKKEKYFSPLCEAAIMASESILCASDGSTSGSDFGSMDIIDLSDSFTL